MSLNKRGGLEISINAIVILILAVTVLGLGLTFIRNIMGGAMEQLSSVSDDIRNDMIERVRDSNERLAFQNNQIDVAKNKKKTLYYGIRNELAFDSDFDVEVGCESSMIEDADPTLIHFNTFSKTTFIPKDGIEVFPVDIRPDPNAVSTTYMCELVIAPGTEPYASKVFYVTVT
ncbi:MAG: hypothetical protein PHV16_02595 [Candidatus Nanoarchaeia archaeon]|nr:hypothetical protein [Candidatus Nanoarchaeia archaeon]